MDLQSRIKETHQKRMKLKKEPLRTIQYGYNQAVLLDHFTFQNLYPLLGQDERPKFEDKHPFSKQLKIYKPQPKRSSQPKTNTMKSSQSLSEKNMSGSKEKQTKNKTKLINQKSLKLEILNDFNPVIVQNLVFDPTRSNRRKDVKINRKLKRLIKVSSDTHSRKDFISAINRQFIPGQIMKMQNCVPNFLPWKTTQKPFKNQKSKSLYPRAHTSSDRNKSLSRFKDFGLTHTKGRWEKIGVSISPWDQFYQI